MREFRQVVGYHRLEVGKNITQLFSWVIMVLLDGQPVNSCSYLAVQAQGRQVTTIEGVMDGPEMHALQRNLLEAGGVQCGFCTPGMIMSAKALLERDEHPELDAVRIGLSGNLCRCTGYAKILAAVEATAVELNT